MTIAEMPVFSVPPPVKNRPYAMADAETWSLGSTVVRVVCDDGPVGWGEACPLGATYQAQHALGARSALAEVAPGLIGADPLGAVALRRRMDGLLSGSRYAKAALDIAACGLTGKRCGGGSRTSSAGR